MLEDFIHSNRDEILARTRARVAKRTAPRPTAHELTHGVPLFLDQLADRLRTEAPSDTKMGASATSHGKEMLRHGFTVAQVVQDYGDVCQVVTALAIELKAPITTEEFRTLNQCLDTATAEAVTEYEHQRDRKISDRGTERLGFMAHELRNVLNSAVMSFELLKRGDVGVGGSTGAVLGRSLSNLRHIIDRALAEVRLESGLVQQKERIRVWEFMEEVEVLAAFEANQKGLALTVTCADHAAEVEIDRHILASAIGNLLQNAFKFTDAGGTVTLNTRVTTDRVLIDIEDECGGLPPGNIEELFRPFEQRSADRSGLGLGLAISRRGVEANGGNVHVRNVPGKGCVFTVDLPMASLIAHAPSPGPS